MTPFVDYLCYSCKRLCLVPRDKECVQYHECPDCFAVPDLQREPVDNPPTTPSWTNTPSAGTAERRALPSGAAGSGGSPPDPEAGAQEGGPTGPTENERRSPSPSCARVTRASGSSAVQTTLGRWSE